MPALQLNSRPLETNIERGGTAKGSHPHGSPGSIAEGFVHEGSESCQGRAAEEGEGGQEEEEAVEVAGVGVKGDTDSDGDEDNGDDDKVVDDIEWDDLENEDVLTGINSSLQGSGPFLFHKGEGTSGEPAKTGHTIGLL